MGKACSCTKLPTETKYQPIDNNVDTIRQSIDSKDVKEQKQETNSEQVSVSIPPTDIQQQIEALKAQLQLAKLEIGTLRKQNTTLERRYACNPPKCQHIFRMINALIFYSTIKPMYDDKHRKKFMQYFTEEYEEALEDYVHIMDHHQNDIESCNKLMDLKLMAKCEIENCVFIRRRYRDGDQPILRSIHAKCLHIDECTQQQIIQILQLNDFFKEESINQWKEMIIEYIKQKDIDGKKLMDKDFKFGEEVAKYCGDKEVKKAAEKVHEKFSNLQMLDADQKEQDLEFTFYVDIIDSIHCHWYHLYETGLRVKLDDVKEQIGELQTSAKNFDPEFAMRSKAIIKTQSVVKEINGFTDRFVKKKFTLQMTGGKLHFIC